MSGVIPLKFLLSDLVSKIPLIHYRQDNVYNILFLTKKAVFKTFLSALIVSNTQKNYRPHTIYGTIIKFILDGPVIISNDLE